MSIRYIVPNGTGDGSSVAAGAPITDLNNQCVLAGAGGEVWILVGMGAHYIPMAAPGVDSTANQQTFAQLTSQVGTSTAPVKICGRKEDGSAGYAVIKSQRIRPYTSTNNMHRMWEGQAGLAVWVDYVNFEYLKFRDMGFGCIMLSGPSGSPAARQFVNIDHVRFDNVRRGIWAKSNAGVSNSNFTNLWGRGTSKSFVRLDGYGDNVKIERFNFDGDCQIGDNFAEGIHFNGTTPGYSNCSVKNGTLRNFWEVLFSSAGVYDTATYWNADGLASERADSNLYIENVHAYDCTDGGFDLKSTNTTLVRCTAKRNKRNFRIWGNATLIDCVGEEAMRRGGSGSAVQAWFNDGGATILGGRYDNKTRTSSVFEQDGTAAVNIGRSGRGAARINIPAGAKVYDGSGPYSIDQNTKVVTTPPSTLKLADFLGATPTAIYGLRKLKADYTGYAIKVRRANDSTTIDVGFTSTGDLDTTAISTFCGSAIGTIQIWYDQTGLGRNMTTASTTREYRIYSGTAVYTKNSKPAAFIDAEDRGYTATVPAIGINKVAAVMVASVSNTATTAAPRFMSLIGSSTGSDANSVGRAIMIGRNGSTTPTANFGVNRNGWLITASTTYDQLTQVASIFDGTNANVYQNNASPTTAASTANFSASRITLGYNGSTFSSCPNAYVSEAWFFESALSAADRAELYSNQNSYYAFASAPPPPPGGDWPVPAGWSVLATELFDAGLGDWTSYDNPSFGPNGDDPAARWRSSQVSTAQVSGVWEAQLAAQKVGSVYNMGSLIWDLPITQRSTTTRIEFRAKFDTALAFKGVAMYYPSDDSTWPQHGELDIWEFGGGSRDHCEMNIHYGTSVGDGSAFTEYHSGSIDFSQWHDIAFEWGTAAGSEYTAAWCDGTKYADSRDSTGYYYSSTGSPINVPNAQARTMLVIFQQDAPTGHPSSDYETTPKIMHIQRVRVLAPVGGP